jgi:plasmid replication initiation protein
MQKRRTDQYSLSLFGGHATDIFKKPVQASQMIVQNDVMTGQQLLAWNILVKNAKEQKDLWKRDPQILRHTERTYRISRKELMLRMGYRSTNRKPFKQALLKMQDIKATWDVLGTDNDHQWASCVLLPFVQCDEESVTYAFVGHIEPMLFESAMYSKLDLIIQRNLKLDASRKLYDWLNRYRTNPSHLSNKDTWIFWRKIIHGNVDENSYTKEYKIFKRDKLKPAIQEINQIADLIIELIEDKDGTRGVKFLQFKVHEKPKFTENQDPRANLGTVSLQIEKEFSKLQVSDYFQKKILTEFAQPLIIANIQYTLSRIKNNPNSIKNQGAYLLAACKANFAEFHSEAATKLVPVNDISEQSQKIMVAIHQARSTQAESMFKEMPSSDQEKLSERYNQLASLEEEKIPFHMSKRLNRHLIPFYGWLAKQTWGDPDAQEIIQYTLQMDISPAL